MTLFGLVEREKANHRVTHLCRALDVSTSGYYAWRTRGPSRRARRNAELLVRIREIHAASRKVYGSPRVHAELVLGRGIRCSRKRVARLMRSAGLAGIHRGRIRGCTRRDEARQPQPDLVKRQFEQPGPNRLWVADLTQHATAEGWLYLATVLDAYSRRIVGWSMGDRAQAGLVMDALNMAIWQRRPGQGLVHHSDHGAQYTSLTFTKRLEEAGILGSMGTVGDALDNAMAESFFATLQVELLDRNRWPTRKALASAIFTYIEVFYNRRRRHSALGYLSPDEYERKTANSVQRSRPEGHEAVAT